MKTTTKTTASTLGLLLMVLVAYWPIMDGGFIVDDETYVYENENLHNVAGLGRIWFDIDASPQYYPLVFSSFWIEYQFWGASPSGYHVSNIFLHAVNVLLFWVILSRLSVGGAWFAAAMFAVHPVHAESVAWIAERKNVLSALFYLLAALAYIRFATSRETESSRSKRLLYWTSVLLFVLALLSKTAAVTLPVVLILILWWKRGRIGRVDLLHVTPLLVIGFGLGMITVWIETTRGGASGELWDLSWIERLLVAARAVWFYAAKLAWPLSLSFNYPRWQVDSLIWWLYPLTLGSLLAVLWLMRGRLGRGPLASLLYFIVTLGPTLGFVNVYFFRYAYVADHFQYLASMGPLALIAAMATTRWSQATRQRQIARNMAMAALLSVLGVLTWQRSALFGDLETLCRDTLVKNPSSWLATNNLGNIYLQRGDLESAVEYFEIARETAPTYLETHLNLAIAYMNLGHFDDAIESARRSLQIRPDNKFGFKSLGDIYLRIGKPAEAVPWFREALERDPQFSTARVGLGTALARAGHSQEAVEVLLTALQDDPENVAARANLAAALAQLDRFDEAIRHFEMAIALDPGNQTLRQNLDLARSKAAEAVRNIEQQ